MRRVDLIDADPAPRRRWTQSLVDLTQYGMAKPFNDALPLDVAVASMDSRVRMRHSFSTVYAGDRTLPPLSFIEVRPGLAISCPELLFIEMGAILDLPDQLKLGHELCGEFSRDARDPLNGPIAYKLKPVTSCAKIEAYLEQTRWLPGVAQSRRALDMLADNAWSSTESIVATMAALPLAEFGYGLDVVMNRRVETPEALSSVTDASSRVPDILFNGTHVGINYDGAVHLDLDSIVHAAMDLGRDPGNSMMGIALDRVVRDVRAKAVDDIRRNRELAAAGYVVFPVIKEDLYEEGGLDRVMMQVFEALEAFGHCDMSRQRRMMNSKLLRAKRQELVWSLLPGKHREFVSNRKDALPYLYATPEVREISIGF